MLRDGRRADEQVLRQLLQHGNERGRGNDPAESPAGHAEVLRETVDDEHLVAELQRARGRSVVSQALVDLVADHESAPAAHRGDQLRENVRSDRCAGRIGRRGDEDAARGIGPVRVDVRCGELEPLGGPARHEARATAEGGCEVPVAWIARVRHQHLGVALEQRGAREQQGTGGPGGDDDPPAVDRASETGRVPVRDPLAQRLQAQRVRVLGLAAIDRGAGRAAHGLRRREVRLADGQVNDGAAGGGEFRRLLHDLHDVERLDQGCSGGSSRHGRFSCERPILVVRDAARVSAYCCVWRRQKKGPSA